MKKGLKGFVAGAVVGALTTGTVGALAGYSNYIEAYYNNIKIVVDGTEIHPNSEPFISNGTTYLPVRDVANAFGQSVYWDGPNYTVYLGDMSGTLDYASATLKDVDNIGDKFYEVGSDKLTDNYGNSYSYAFRAGRDSSTYQTLLNMKYSRFKCTLYVQKGYNQDYTAKILIKTDGKIVYTSPEITKTSRPINVDVDITGCNDFQIVATDGDDTGYIADAGFYQ